MSNLMIDKIESSSNEMMTLSKEDQKMIIGGVATCTYASQTYSQGAVVNGQTCQADGSWSRPN